MILVHNHSSQIIKNKNVTVNVKTGNLDSSDNNGKSTANSTVNERGQATLLSWGPS